jgi:hypothetical protein
MKTDTELVATTIAQLTQQWHERLISRPRVPQGGQQWEREQQQMVVDSVFRGNPLP